MKSFQFCIWQLKLLNLRESLRPSHTSGFHHVQMNKTYVKVKFSLIIQMIYFLPTDALNKIWRSIQN